MQNAKLPVSPTPTVVFDRLGQFLEDYKQAKKCDNALPSPPSQTDSNCSKTDLLKKSQAVDLLEISKYLPADPAIQTKVVSDIIQYYAGIGRLDCISNFEKNPELLSSWRKPSGIMATAEEQYFEFQQNGVDTRMTTTEWNNILVASNETAGRSIRLCPPYANQLSDRYSRQTDTVRMKEAHINLMITPTAALTGSTPPLMDAEFQIVECMVFVDTMALLSNKYNGFGQALGMVDTSFDQYKVSDSPNVLFTMPLGSGVTPPSGVFAYANMMPAVLTKDSRFRILMHKKFPIKYYSNWLETTDNKCVQAPGENQFHQLRVPLDFVAPYSSNTDVEPYINNCYFMLWGNTSTTTSNNYYSICHYNIRVTFKDIGDQ